MKKFKVEFNTSGFYQGAGIWETLDEINEIEAETAQEAIRYAKEYFVETGTPIEEVNEYAWKAAERIFDEYGFLSSEWEYEE